MIIRQNDRVLITAGHTRIVSRDAYSVVVETTGLTPKGDQATYQIAISLNELALMLPPGEQWTTPRAIRPQSLAREGYERAWHDKRNV